MLELERDLPEVYLLPGEAYFSRRPSIMRTILGSCVGVTFWSAKQGAGALCHALLPRCPRSSAADFTATENRRYVDFAIRDLARKFDRIGAIRAEVQVKLFGGADVLPISSPGPLRPTVGKQNCEVALEVLKTEGFEIVASSLGGTTGRSIQFHTTTGEVRLRWISRVVIDDDVHE